MLLCRNKILEKNVAPPSVEVAIIFGVFTSINPCLARNSLVAFKCCVHEYEKGMLERFDEGLQFNSILCQCQLMISYLELGMELPLFAKENTLNSNGIISAPLGAFPLNAPFLELPMSNALLDVGFVQTIFPYHSVSPQQFVGHHIYPLS